MNTHNRLGAALADRFEDAPALNDLPATDEALAFCANLAGRSSCRRFAENPVPKDMMRLLAALALSAPSKSDLQQRDIIWPRDSTVQALKSLLNGQDWIAAAPELLIFCGNNHRQRQMHALWDRPFANDHLDAFFNASVDAGIALATAVMAAETLGLGCCPISTIRNHGPEVRAVLGLPDHVFPVAALAVGWPQDARRTVSPRLPLSATFHEGRYEVPDFKSLLDAYDQSRLRKVPPKKQRATEEFGLADAYRWSDDKTRQYAQPERTGFGDYIRSIGFKLD
ncbi:MAG: nitroreductase family protein [Pseudomonadota bacterium]